MTDFVTQITNGQNATAFAAWWATVPSTVPVGDRYIAEIGTENLNERVNFTTRTINGDVIVRVVSGEKHNGTRGSGIAIQPNGQNAADILQFNAITGTGRIIVQDLEIATAVVETNGPRILDPGSAVPEGFTIILQRCLVTSTATGANRLVNFSNAYTMHLISNRFWGETGNGAPVTLISGFSNAAQTKDWIVQGNIVQSDSGETGIGVSLGANNISTTRLDVQGNMVFTSGTCYVVSDAGSAVLVFAQNVSEDTTGQVTGATVVNDIVSVDNPDVKAGSIALQVWTNKPTTYGAELDVYSNNRSTIAQTAEWDAGSMQFSTASAPDSDVELNLGANGSALQTLESEPTVLQIDNVLDVPVAGSELGTLASGVPVIQATEPPVDVSPTGDGLQTMEVNDDVNLEASITLVLDTDGSPFGQLDSDNPSEIQGVTRDITMTNLQDEISFFPLQSGAPAFTLPTSGDIQLAIPPGDEFGLLDSDPIAGIIDTDDILVVVSGAQFGQMGSGVPFAILIAATGVTLVTEGATFLLLASSAPLITISSGSLPPPGGGGSDLIIRSVTRDVTRPVTMDVDETVQVFNN